MTRWSDSGCSSSKSSTDAFVAVPLAASKIQSPTPGKKKGTGLPQLPCAALRINQRPGTRQQVREALIS